MFLSLELLRFPPRFLSKAAVRALTWDEIVVMLNALPKDKQYELDKIFQKVSSTLMSLIMMTLKVTKEEDEIIELERIKRIVNMCPKDELFIRIKDKIWAVRQQLDAEDADYFLNKDYSAMVRRDHNQAFVEAMMEILKLRYYNSTAAEKKVYFAKGRILIAEVAAFKDLVGESK